MLKHIVVATWIALLAHGGALAQEYFDFGRIPGVPDEPNVQVDLNAALLAFVAEAARGSDANMADALAGIEGIRVRVYEKLDDAAAVAGFIDDSSKTLERAGWQRTVYVADEEEKVRIYVKMSGQQMSGMTVMVVDNSEAVFINIAGSISPAQLGRVARGIGVGDVLGGFGAPGGSETRNRGALAPQDAEAAADDDR